MKSWECGVCGYVHKGQVAPEKCPVCEAPEKMFKEMMATEAFKDETVAGPEKRWRCTVCGYVHAGVEPPENCPVCAAPKKMFVEIDEAGKALSSIGNMVENSTLPPLGEMGQKPSSSLFDKFASLVLRFHLHPIMVHFPNGILPVVLLFLGLSVCFNILALETAAYYNLVFVLLMLPLVLLTGFIEWQKRYKGIKSAIFITKILCSLIVLALVNILVFWRLLDPEVMTEGSPSKLIYFGIAAVTLGAAGLAGHLGGKLVFGSRE